MYSAQPWELKVCCFLFRAFKDLAEFVVHLGEESESLEEFVAKLKSNGSAVTQALGESLFSAISKYKNKKLNSKPAGSGVNAASDGDRPQDSSTSKDGNAGNPSSVLPPTAFSVGKHAPTEKELKFPGLCMQNRFDLPQLQLERPDEHQPLSSAAQRLLEAEKDERELIKEQQEALRKSKSGPGYWAREDAKSDPSLQRGRGSGTGANAVPVGGRAGEGVTSELNFCGRRGAPIVRYGIYDGTVTRVMDYGAFVQLDVEGGRKEGLVHVADMTKGDGRANIASYVFTYTSSAIFRWRAHLNPYSGS